MKYWNFDISCIYWCHHVDAGAHKWLGSKCILYKQDTKNSFLDNVCCIFEDNYILWIIFVFHPGYTSLILETVLIKFGGPRGRGPTYRVEGRRPRKTITRGLVCNLSSFFVFLRHMICSLFYKLTYVCSYDLQEIIIYKTIKVKLYCNQQRMF